MDFHGAGRRSFVQALERVCGWRDDIAYIQFHGNTDLNVLREIFARHGAELTPAKQRRFFAALGAELERLAPGAVTTRHPGGDQAGGTVSCKLLMPRLLCIRLCPEDAAAAPPPAAEPLSPDPVSQQFRGDLWTIDTMPGEVRGLWAQELVSPGFAAEVMGGNTSIADPVYATLGTISQIAEIAPRNPQSFTVSLRRRQDNGRPDGVCVKLGCVDGRYQKTVSLWIRASASGGRRRIPLRLGSSKAYSRVELEAERWHQLTVPWAVLFPGRSGSRFYLYSPLANETADEQETFTFEINGISALGHCTAAGTPVAAAVSLRQLDTRDAGVIRYLVLVEPGKALYHELRFPQPLRIAELQSQPEGLTWDYRPEARLLALKHEKVGAGQADLEPWRQWLEPTEFQACLENRARPLLVTLRLEN